MKKEHYLVVNPYQYIPFTNSGGKILNYKIAQYLGFNYQTFVLSTSDNEKPKEQSYQEINILAPKKYRYLPFYKFLTLKKIIEKLQISNIIIIQPYLGATFISLSKLLNKNLTLISHNIEAFRFKSMGKSWWRILFYYEKWVMRSADKVCFVTEEDMNQAIENYRLNKDICFFTPFGTDFKEIPKTSSKYSKQETAEIFSLDANKEWVYFIGSQSYMPNYKAVEDICREICTRISKNSDPIQILIIGGGLPLEIDEILKKSTPQVKYLGFVENIDDVIHHCSTMLNPTLIGGGIKTKAIEALAFNKNLVSFENSAYGINREVASNKLYISKDGDWQNLYENLLKSIQNNSDISKDFYEKYHWEAIIETII